jgi:hypothetical protein
VKGFRRDFEGRCLSSSNQRGGKIPGVAVDPQSAQPHMGWTSLQLHHHPTRSTLTALLLLAPCIHSAPAQPPQVRFFQVSEDELESLRERFEAGQYDINIEKKTFSVHDYNTMISGGHEGRKPTRSPGGVKSTSSPCADDSAVKTLPQSIPVPPCTGRRHHSAVPAHHSLRPHSSLCLAPAHHPPLPPSSLCPTLALDPTMKAEVVAWKAQQRIAMAKQLQLEQESLARLEVAKSTEPSAQGGSMFGAGESAEDPAWSAPGMTKVDRGAPAAGRVEEHGCIIGPRTIHGWKEHVWLAHRCIPHDTAMAPPFRTLCPQVAAGFTANVWDIKVKAGDQVRLLGRVQERAVSTK